ncbi:GNAT family N-acetyltransferase [Saccharomonospora sp.]|uniref:GNAT family N-acetyltransferase n=1 Tax=Saccharomonospora sp. TaxID=33913 RepID=UPI00261EB49A|nr:GNAT family N-acetyltransferase [Saccharomonospora sp.]
MSVEVLDPRFDAEPPYWRELRARAGLRGDWAWDVLRRQAWCARTPWYLTVLLDGSRPRGMVGAAWVGSRTRRHRFAVSGCGGRIGGLDLRAPGSSAFPSWWFADVGDDGGCRQLLSEYVPTVRRLLGPGLKGTLIRQVPEAALPVVDGRWRLVRETEPVARMSTEPFGGRDDWLASLPRRRRAHLRGVFARVEDDDSLTVEFLPGDRADAVEVAELLRVNEVKHRDVPIVPLPQFVGYLRCLLEQPDVFVLSYRDTETRRLLGATTVYDHPQWPLARAWSSLRVEDGGRPDLYFHMYGELVRWAIAQGKNGVVLGKKMSQVKASLGAELVPQYAAAIPVR